MMSSNKALRLLGRLGIAALLIIASPLIWLWLLLDFARLKRVALEVEPRNEAALGQDHPIYARAFDWFLRNIVGKVLIVLFLPLIAIVGMFMCAFEQHDDKDDIIW
jgi:hypothetical protein